MVAVRSRRPLSFPPSSSSSSTSTSSVPFRSLTSATLLWPAAHARPREGGRRASGDGAARRGAMRQHQQHPHQHQHQHPHPHGLHHDLHELFDAGAAEALGVLDAGMGVAAGPGEVEAAMRFVEGGGARVRGGGGAQGGGGGGTGAGAAVGRGQGRGWACR